MKSPILTLFPDPAERYVTARPALTGAPSSERTEGLQLAAGAVNTLPSIESVILQKLLAEVEARQMTRAQPTYVIEQSPAARHTTLQRTLWCALWALSIVVSVLTVKYIDSQTMVPRENDAQSRSIEKLTASISYQNQAFSTVTDSLQQLANAIASSAKQTAALPQVLDRLGSNLQQVRSPAVRPAPEAASQPVSPVIIGTSPQSIDSAPIPMGGHIHPPIEWAVAPPNVVVHHNSRGVMDYWLMPRTVAGVPTIAKVVPILQNNSGTFVHHIAEVKDYIVTPSGDWIEASESSGNK
jgi:hypothetical protein